MNLSYRRAQRADIPFLLQLRLEVLRAANMLPVDTPLPEVERNTAGYLQEHFDDQVTILAYDGGEFAACGSIVFYELMPTYHYPQSVCAKIMNMYTRPAYRRHGIATMLLTMLMDEAKTKGKIHISLEATAVGRFVYEKLGFLSADAEMYLP